MRLKLFRLPALAVPLMWNGGASVIAQGATLVVTAVLSNWLGPVSFARYAVTVNTTQTLSAVAQAGLSFTATNFVARYQRQDPTIAAKIARVCLQIASMSGIIVGAGLALLATWLAAHVYHDASVKPSLMAAAVAVPFAACSLVQIGISVGLARFRMQAVAALVYAVALVSCAMAGLVSGVGATGAAIGFAIAIALRVGFTQSRLAELRRPNATGIRSNRDLLREIVPFALPAGLAGLTLTPAIWGANALLAARHGLHDLGLFAAAFTLKTLVAFVPLQAGTVFLPRYVSARNDTGGEAQRQLIVMVLAAGAFSTALAGPIAVLARPVMSVFGPSFAEGALILRWLMLGVILECTATVWSYRLAADRRMWTSLLAYTWPKDLILVAAAFLLVPRYGAPGLAMAHAVSWLYANAVLALLSVRRSSPQRLPDDGAARGILDSVNPLSAPSATPGSGVSEES